MRRVALSLYATMIFLGITPHRSTTRTSSLCYFRQMVRHARSANSLFGVSAMSLILSMACFIPTVRAQESVAPEAIEHDVESRDDSTSEEDEARDLFDEGIRAYRAGRPVEAQRHLRQSLQLRGSPATAFNLVMALRATEAYVEAVEILESLLEGEYGDLEDSSRRDHVSELLAELSAEIATLNISTTHSSRITAFLDTIRLGDLSAGQQLLHRVRPGTHTITGRLDEGAEVEQQIEALANEEVSVILDFPNSTERPRRRWWIGVVVASLTVAAAVGIALGLTLWEPEPENVRPWGTVTALSVGNDL